MTVLNSLTILDDMVTGYHLWTNIPKYRLAGSGASRVRGHHQVSDLSLN